MEIFVNAWPDLKALCELISLQDVCKSFACPARLATLVCNGYSKARMYV